YAVNMGATTIWERWNSILPDGKISGTEMNSLNHYSYGSVVEWMYRNMAGLHVEEEHPGFTHVTIAPQPDYRITQCDMKYQSIAGTYEISWQVETSGAFYLKVTVPFGASAKIVLPNTTREPEEVEAGVHVYSYMPEAPIIKIYSSASPFSELLENPKTLAVVERFIPGWQAVPGGMHDMTVEMLKGTPFVDLTGEQTEAFNAELRNCQ
ncbi:MAG: alfa-L-rhamnosidase RamA, partial [Lachnospiraceae bacterium]|nr:alfa-L-rhamnosidase RamA [Lachnospiraceae bacterium]